MRQLNRHNRSEVDFKHSPQILLFLYTYIRGRKISKFTSPGPEEKGPFYFHDTGCYETPLQEIGVRIREIWDVKS